MPTTPLSPKIKFTQVEQSEIFNELVKRIPLLTDKWTDTNASEIGISLVDLYAGVAAYLCFMLDKKAQDLYLPTVRTPESLHYLAKLVGYKIQSRSSAKTTLLFSTVDPSNTILIPKYTRCSANIGTAAQNFVTMNSAVISAGDYNTSVEAWQGFKNTNLFISNGVANQKYTLYTQSVGSPLSSKVAWGSVDVMVDGVIWTIVNDFSLSDKDSLHCVVETNYDKTVSVLFGDGYSGAIPSTGANIEVIFLETEGEGGNLGVGTIIKINDTLYDIDGDAASVSVINTSEASGGKGEETLFHAKKLMPAMVRTHARAVTKEDFIYYAESFPGILQARVVDINDYDVRDFDIDYYQIRIVVIPDNGLYVSQQTKQSLYNLLTLGEGSKYVTADIEVMDPIYLPIDLVVKVVYDKQYTLDEVKTAIYDTIQDFFKPSESPFHERILTGIVDGQYIGEDVDFITLASNINNTKGVKFIKELTLTCTKGEYGLNKAEQNVPVSRFEMPTLNKASIGLD